jgi:hypothetical protein
VSDSLLTDALPTGVTVLTGVNVLTIAPTDQHPAHGDAQLRNARG